MGEYRNRTTGEVKTQGQWRAANANMSLPKVWKAATLDALDLDPVLEVDLPTVGTYQTVARNGVEQNSDGDWVQSWQVVDMFADDDDGTKAEHEAAFQAQLDAATAETNRTTRDNKLAETDFYALSDVTMSAEMTTYRQALRDITTHANWPNLEEADWPTKP